MNTGHPTFTVSLLPRKRGPLHFGRTGGGPVEGYTRQILFCVSGIACMSTRAILQWYKPFATLQELPYFFDTDVAATVSFLLIFSLLVQFVRLLFEGDIYFFGKPTDINDGWIRLCTSDTATTVRRREQ